MAKSPTPATGAREPDLEKLPEDSSAATPPVADIVPEPFNPNFENKDSETGGGAPAPGTGGGDEVERIDVETAGKFMLQDPYTLDVVEAEGTSNVRRTSFIDEKLLSGQLLKAKK